MSALGGMPTPRHGALAALVLLALALAGCEYTGPEEPPSPASAAATADPHPFEENAREVVRLLEGTPADPGMPSETEPAGKLELVLAAGDYVVTGACAGVYGAKLTIVREDVVPEAAEFACEARLERFFRHDGGPVTISAVPPTGKPSATGVKVQANTDARLSELEDFSDWSAAQLKPRIPGEFFGSRSTNATIGDTLMVDPGRYTLEFVCSEAPWAEVSVATAAGIEVLAPVRIQCGQPISTTIALPGQGADLTMSPVFGPEGRFAYRLIPVTPPGPPAGTPAPPG